MISKLGRRRMISGAGEANDDSSEDEFEEKLGLLLQEQRREANDRERELNVHRSGSAPHNDSLEVSEFADGNAFMSEEEPSSGPAYVSYNYSNVNSNPRLPPPVFSKEAWRFTQRLQGGGGGVGRGGIGDRRKANRTDGGGRVSLVSMPPGFDSKKPENENSEVENATDSAEWGGDGLIGLPGFGLGSKHKSLAQIFQDDLSHSSPASEHPSRLTGRNTFEHDETLGPTEADLVQMQHNNDLPTSYSYAPIRNLTGGGRVNSSEKRSSRSQNPSKESENLVTALSGMNLSNRVMNERKNRAQFNQNPRYNSSTMPNYNSRGSNNLYVDGSSSNFYGARDPLYSNYAKSPQLTLSQVSNLNLPPLVENPAPTTMAFPRMESRFGLESQNPTRMPGNTPFLDPMYLQYRRTAAAAQIAALNDPAPNRNSYLGNSYTDFLPKAYLGTLSSPHRSHYSGKPGSSNTPFSLQMRNLGGGGGGIMGQWHLDDSDDGFVSSLLKEFKSNTTKSFELSDIMGHVVEFSVDPNGSRFIQQKLETATTEEKNMVLEEIFPHALTLMTDIFGNYVIQMFFEHGMKTQRRELAGKLIGHVLTLSLEMHGCRVIQKAIEVVDMDQKIKIVEELDGQIMRCVLDQNGNHVIQKCVECVPERHIRFIITAVFGQVVTLSTHPYGCRVIQRVLKHCENEETQSKVRNEIFASAGILAQDPHGNYVIQHVLEHGKPEERSIIIRELAGKIVQLSQQKFASNVIEKCLTFGNARERQFLVKQMLCTTDEYEPLQVMMKDPFANFVVQKALELCTDQEREHILTRVKVHLDVLKKYTHGKHIVARVEKLVADGERRVAVRLSHAD